MVMLYHFLNVTKLVISRNLIIRMRWSLPVASSDTDDDICLAIVGTNIPVRQVNELPQRLSFLLLMVMD